MGFRLKFDTSAPSGPSQAELDRQYAQQRFDANPDYWLAEARKANPSSAVNVLGGGDEYYRNLAIDLAGTEGMRAAAMQSIASDGGISGAIGGITDTLGDLGLPYLGNMSGGLTGAAAISGGDVQSAAAIDLLGLSAAPSLGAAGLGAAAPAATSGAGAGTALKSTAAVIGENVSTPALTTLAGPTGTSLLSTTVPTATLGTGTVAASGAAGIAASSELAEAGAKAALPSAGMTMSDTIMAATLASQMAPMLFADAPDMGAAAQDMGARPGKGGGNGGPSTENRERAFETRKQAAGRAAAAAGAKRVNNDADLLGQSGRTTQRRKAGVQRTVLGY